MAIKANASALMQDIFNAGMEMPGAKQAKEVVGNMFGKRSTFSQPKGPLDHGVNFSKKRVDKMLNSSSIAKKQQALKQGMAVAGAGGAVGGLGFGIGSTVNRNRRNY